MKVPREKRWKKGETCDKKNLGKEILYRSGIKHWPSLSNPFGEAVFLRTLVRIFASGKALLAVECRNPESMLQETGAVQLSGLT